MIVVVLILCLAKSFVLVVDGKNFHPHPIQLLDFDELLKFKVSYLDSFHVGEHRQISIRRHIVILVFQHVLEFLKERLPLGRQGEFHKIILVFSHGVAVFFVELYHFVKNVLFLLDGEQFFFAAFVDLASIVVVYVLSFVLV
jgi:hypothetical protein